MTWPPRFIFLGGTIAIDFAQTGGEGGRSRFERWHTPKDMADWAELDPMLGFRPSVSRAEYDTAWQLREALWSTIQDQLAEKSPSPSNLALIERAAAAPDLVPYWPNGERAAWRPDATFTQVMSHVARDAIDLFGTDRAKRFRKCASPTCGLTFVDNSRPGKRQWCAMERCGNLHKAATQRAKRRLTRGAADEL